MNPIEFAEFIRDLQSFLLSGYNSGEGPVDIDGEIIILQESMDSIFEVLHRGSFWVDYMDWKRKNE